jgi:TonB-linked SusC/RagA family outer membrane protein
MEKLKFKRCNSVAAFLLTVIFMAFSLGSYAQQKTISGKVTDQTGSPIPGVTVVIKGTTTGTISNIDGNYQMVIPTETRILTYSYVGMKSQDVEVGNQVNINVVMEADVIGVDEVVVTGYASQSRASLTGAISSVTADKLVEVPAANAAQKLQGKVSGVNIVNSHTPGGDATVRVRGMSTINNNNPLFVIDGVPTTGGLSQINPNDIESITVLKDAASAAIYGARGANGVIIITTKRGTAGEPKISFDVRYGVTNSGKYYDLMNTQEYGEMLWLQAKNSGQTPGNALYGYGDKPSIPDYILPARAAVGSPEVDPKRYNYDQSSLYLIMPANKEGTDWWDAITHTGIIQEYNMQVSGGTTKSNYAFSGGYYDEDGILKHTNWKRYSIRSNVDSQFKNWLKVGQSLGVTHTHSSGTFGNNDEGTVVSQAYRMQPIVPVYDIMRNFGGTRAPTTGNGANPLAGLYRDQNDYGKNLRVLANAYLEVDIISGLKAKTLFGTEYGTYNGRDITIKNPEFSEAITVDRLSHDYQYWLQWNWQNILTYNTTINNVHKINVMAGTEAVSNLWKQITAGRSTFFSTAPTYMYLNAGEKDYENAGTGSDWKTVSYFTRANYDYLGKYLLEFTFRRDGSSRFGSNNRWGNFPAFSAGWRISQESFMSSATWLDDLKLRLGWGESGNDQIGNYNGFTTFRANISNSAYPITGSNTSPVMGYDSNAFGNPDARWETTRTTNVGVDLTVLNGKLNFVLDGWVRNTTDMLYQMSVPHVVGNATLPNVNIGEMKNTGIDFTTNYYGKSANGDFKYTITANISHYKNEIVKLNNNPKEFLEGTALREMQYVRSYIGDPYPAYFGFIVDGIFQSKAEADAWPAYGTYNAAGRFKYRDISGPEGKPDGKIDANDRTYLGSPHPDLYGGLSIDLQYKGFDLSAFMVGSYGNELVNYVDRWIYFNNFSGNRHVDRLYKSWGSPYLTDNKKATMPIAEMSDSGSQQPSSWYVQDGSYLRLKSLQLGYTLPNSALNKVGFSKLRVFVQATNLFTLTKYRGLDPEVRDSNDREWGIDQGAWPVAKQIMFGVNLGI